MTATAHAVHQAATAADAVHAEETVHLLQKDNHVTQVAKEKAEAVLHLLLHVHAPVVKNINAG